MKWLDLQNLKFRTWTAIRYEHRPKRGVWHCRCDCGEERVIHGKILTRAPPYCRCSVGRRVPKDVSGKKFGYWTAIEFRGWSETPKGPRAIWLLRCVCGTEREQRVSGRIQYSEGVSCGCKRGSHRHTSAGWRSPTYSSWANMLARCTQPSNPAFEHYQRRGIGVCDRWRYGEADLGGFECFLADIGERPSPRHTIERDDNDKGYEPDNCRWATKIEQANNRVTNIHFEYRGKRYTLAELARHTGVSKEVLRSRLSRSDGWTVEGAVSAPVRHYGRQRESAQ